MEIIRQSLEGPAWAIRGFKRRQANRLLTGHGVMMACNGEIDNHLELREWLIDRGRTVEQSTDVAVIPAMYLKLGDAFVERLKGAFAIAIWDPREKKILLARDRLAKDHFFYRSTTASCFCLADSGIGIARFTRL